MANILQTSDIELLKGMITNAGRPLYDLTFESPVLLVFLRHFGCIFCKDALAEIARKRPDIEAGGVRLVFVHMGNDETATAYFSKFNLDGSVHISDPGQRYYAAFGLQRGTFNQLFGLQVWMRGFQITGESGYPPELAKKLGDSFQMPGVFVLQDGEIREQFIHQNVAERPDYMSLLKCCVYG